jgi:cyanate lyase
MLQSQFNQTARMSGDAHVRILQSQFNQTAREQLAETVVAAKAAKDLSWKGLAEGTGLTVAFATAALLGQHPLPRPVAEMVGERLGLDAGAIRLLQSVPLRGSIPDGVPTDPTIYRFYEVIQIYGATLKALVAEEFGDGIMSSINFKLTVDKEEDPDGGDRVIVTLNGKHLPTKPY